VAEAAEAAAAAAETAAAAAEAGAEAGAPQAEVTAAYPGRAALLEAHSPKSVPPPVHKLVAERELSPRFKTDPNPEPEP